MFEFSVLTYIHMITRAHKYMHTNIHKHYYLLFMRVILKALSWNCAERCNSRFAEVALLMIGSNIHGRKKAISTSHKHSYIAWMVVDGMVGLARLQPLPHGRCVSLQNVTSSRNQLRKEIIRMEENRKTSLRLVLWRCFQYYYSFMYWYGKFGHWCIWCCVIYQVVLNPGTRNRFLASYA